MWGLNDWSLDGWVGEYVGGSIYILVSLVFAYTLYLHSRCNFTYMAAVYYCVKYKAENWCLISKSKLLFISALAVIIPKKSLGWHFSHIMWSKKMYARGIWSCYQANIYIFLLLAVCIKDAHDISTQLLRAISSIFSSNLHLRYSRFDFYRNDLQYLLSRSPDVRIKRSVDIERTDALHGAWILLLA